MTLKTLSGGLYRPLSDEQVKTIHEAALTLLEQVGVGFEPDLEEEVQLLEQSGATVDRDRSRIFLPRDVVEAQAQAAPNRVVLHSRSGEFDLDLADHHVYLGTGGAAIRILDLETGEARPTTLQDLYQLGRLVDRLDNIHFFLRPCVPTDIPESEYDVNCYYASFKATGKHVMGGVNTVGGLKQVREMAALLAGGAAPTPGTSILSIITSFVISPLKLSSRTVKIMLECARNHIPVALSGAPMAGSTSPLTMAGTLAQTHAEQLAGIALCQLAAPGAPLLYGGIPGRADLQTMGYCGGAVECGMMNAAIHQMAHHIGVPNYNSSGLTDAKVPDAQAGWEKGMTTLLAAMAGSNYVHHAAGMLESMLGLAYEQFVMDDEIIGMSRRVLEGIRVDPEHLALEVIRKVGPGGEFITADHTYDHLHSEYYKGNGITDRSNLDNWVEHGRQDAWKRAGEMVRQVLARPEQSYIPEEIEREIRKRFPIRL